MILSHLCAKKINLEKYIAVTRNKEKEFRNKWKLFASSGIDSRSGNQSITYCLALNHLIILGKYFLYVNALNTITYQFDDFVSLVREKINLEKYTAVTRNKEKEFRNKWKFFLSL
ncbi:hypothetical protein pdam_00012202 [Pocillopora damicornis]|uniref:Uncharacterized protein n=1 Tax=Pocillopora damicornis TaxID=46731 RepID=A0A3M6UE87_POCDA|nr:hypothetical protein pdam_00012202 [Pocillopora damicornis]